MIHYFLSNSDPTAARDFPLGRIDVRRAGTLGSSDLWVATFEFKRCTAAESADGLLPHGTKINSVVVKAYQGNVKPSSDLSACTEITTLIDPAYTPTIQNENQVVCKLQWPGDAFKGEKASLVFFLTLNSGAKQPFFWSYVYIN